MVDVSAFIAQFCRGIGFVWLGLNLFFPKSYAKFVDGFKSYKDKLRTNYKND